MTEYSTIEPDMLQAALTYARRGRPVFPCDPSNKRPFPGTRGFKDATTDEATICAWWAKYPDAMIGMPTGAASRIWVLDIDAPDLFEANCPIELPETRRADTGKGYHLYFEFDPERPVYNTQRNKNAPWPMPRLPGAETRGEGGYVIVPPSLHPEGRRYEWTHMALPAAASDELLELVRERPDKTAASSASISHATSGPDTKYGLKALEDECAAIRAAGNGEQECTLNEAALKIGALVAGGSLSMSTAKSQLITAGLAMPSYNSRDRWTPEGIIAKIDRGLADGAARPRKAPEREAFTSQPRHDQRPPEPEYGYYDQDGVWTAYGEEWEAPGGAAEEVEIEPHCSLDLAALANQRPVAKSFAVERLAPLAEVTLFTGPGSAGKSLLGQQMATCAAAGLPCLRLAVRQGPAIYLTCEDDAEQLHYRQAHICEALRVPMASLAGKLHLISLRGALDNELGTFTHDGRMQLAPAYRRLVATVQATGAELVLLDNVAHVFAGNENDRGDVTRFVNLLNRLASETGAAIILLGHPNKSGDDYSGSTAWLNAVRSQFNIEHDVETDIRKLKIGKANYAQKGDAFRFMWQNWAFVHEDDLPTDTARELRETVLASADNKLFLACLRERNKQRRQVSEKPNAQNYAPKIFEAMPESKGIGRKRLMAAMDRLFRIEAIERGFLWRDTTEGKDIAGLREVSDGSDEVPESPPESVRKVSPESSGKPQE